MNEASHARERSVAGYELDPAFYDEAFVAPGVPRPEYAELLAALDGSDLTELCEAVVEKMREGGVSFGTSEGVLPFLVDPVPRVFRAPEWAELERGLVQRVDALNAFAADVYSDRRIVREGRVPERVLEGAVHLEPEMRGVPVPNGIYAGVAGLDVVRDGYGQLMVLEDNLRTPSGLAYLEAAQDALEQCLPRTAEEHRPTHFRWTLFGEVLRSAAPEHAAGDASVAMLSDGPENSAWWEHRVIASRLDVPIVTLDDLEHRDGALHTRVRDRLRRIDVVYRRTDVDRLRDEAGRPTAIADALLEPCRSGNLACVNAFGSGIGDDKLVHAYVEEMIRFYLGEEPVIPSVPTYDLCEPDRLAECLDRLDELVVKPRTGHGGQGVLIGPRAPREDLERARSAIESEPAAYVAQETVALSRHPTVQRGELVPRHVDLRPFILSAGERTSVVPGGLTRVAFEPGELVVNSSQNGGGKATWVLA